jgi:Family of unknown function (DUF6186)
MSPHDLTVAGYLAIVASAVALQVLSRWPGSRIPSLGRLLSSVMRTRAGRVGVVAGWSWFGLHLLVR